jgi:hypothetical protein
VVAAPRGPDDHAPPDPEHREVALPRLGPIRLANRPDLQVADRPQPEGLQVAQGAGRLGYGGFHGRRIEAGQICPNDGWLGRVDDRAETFVGQPETGFDARAAGREARQDL